LMGVDIDRHCSLATWQGDMRSGGQCHAIIASVPLVSGEAIGRICSYLTSIMKACDLTIPPHVQDASGWNRF
jgi:hypothetical protein